MKDPFVAELVRLSPPDLHTLEFRGSSNLTKVVASPTDCLPRLHTLDISSCPALDFVLVQSDSLTSINLVSEWRWVNIRG